MTLEQAQQLVEAAAKGGEATPYEQALAIALTETVHMLVDLSRALVRATDELARQRGQL